MSEPVTDKTAYRICDVYEADGKAKNYTRTYRIIDEQSQKTEVTADQYGKVIFKGLRVLGADGGDWRLRANRKIMPSRWTLADKDDQPVAVFDQKLSRKFINPLYKTVLAVMDGQENELCRIADLRKTNLAKIVGLEIADYAIVKDKQALAEITSLPREKPRQAKGLLGKMKNFFAATDAAIVSTSDDHPLPAHIVLPMYLLYRELSDTSAE